jgi:hypothetical protein
MSIVRLESTQRRAHAAIFAPELCIAYFVRTRRIPKVSAMGRL